MSPPPDGVLHLQHLPQPSHEPEANVTARNGHPSAASELTTGLLGERISYLAVGDGPPLVMVQVLTPTREVPTGMERRMTLPMVMRLSGGSRVYLVNREA